MADGGVGCGGVYRVWCETESAFVHTDGYVPVPPTSCPVGGASHIVDADTVTLVAREPFSRSLARSEARLRSTVRHIPFDGHLQVRDALERVAPFLWRPPQTPVVQATASSLFVHVRGHASTRAVAGCTVWFVVIDSRTGRIAGSKGFDSLPALVSRTLTVECSVEDDAAQPSSATQREPVPMDVFAMSSDRFTVETVAVSDA